MGKQTAQAKEVYSHTRCNSHYTQTEACGTADSHIDNVYSVRYWVRYTQSLSLFKNTLEDSISLSVKLITQARKGRTTDACFRDRVIKILGYHHQSIPLVRFGPSL